METEIAVSGNERFSQALPNKVYSCEGQEWALIDEAGNTYHYTLGSNRILRNF